MGWGCGHSVLVEELRFHLEMGRLGQGGWGRLVCRDGLFGCLELITGL